MEWKASDLKRLMKIMRKKFKGFLRLEKRGFIAIGKGLWKGEAWAWIGISIWIIIGIILILRVD